MEDVKAEEIHWHFRGRLIWMGTSPLGHDIEKDVKTGRIKRVFSRNEIAAGVARNGDLLPRGTKEAYES